MSNNIREIYTKAVVAKGKKLSRNTYTLTLSEKPNEILGCWITNHHFEAVLNNRVPKIIGTYDVHIWYSCRDATDSLVEKHQISYQDEMQVTKKENRDFEKGDEVKGRCLSKPKCLSATKDNSNVSVVIEKEMQIEVSGETCIKVEVKSEAEIWDDLDDIQIDTNFIK